MLACEEKEILISREEIYEQILKFPCVMAPAKDDVFVFEFLVEKELGYLAALDGDQELAECNCTANTHADSLIEWGIRNLT